MKTKSPVVADVISTLYRSLGMEMTLRMARSLIEGYNINERMGFPPSVPVPVQDAANRVVMDLYDAGLFLELVEWLVKVDHHGFMGKQLPIVGIDEIIEGVKADGYLLDSESGTFYEDSRKQRTRGWGRLRAGNEYPITLLHFDIARNSSLVRANAAQDVERVYETLRSLFTWIVEKRRGRVWDWQGDGGLAAFQYGHPNMSAVLCGIELLDELCVFNITENPLDREILVRTAVHAGFIRYTEVQTDLMRDEVVKEIEEIEHEYTPINSLSVSATVAPYIDGVIKDCFMPIDVSSPWQILCYSIACKSPGNRSCRGKRP
jgi:hypothetical protein